MTSPALTLLIAAADTQPRDFLAAQFDADGHSVHVGDRPQAVTRRLSAHPCDVVLLGDFAAPADTPALLRDLRAGRLHRRVPRGQRVVTIGDPGEAATVRAYEAGSDHHLPRDSSYLVVRAVVDALTRRSHRPTVPDRVNIDALHIDIAARTVQVADTTVALTHTEFELLRCLAADPGRVFAKHELLHAIRGPGTPAGSRTLDSHAHRLRRKLHAAGADHAVSCCRGVGYRLMSCTAAG